MSSSWPRVPLGKVLRERREVPSPDALAMGAIRVVAKIEFNDGRIELRSDAKTKTGMILVRPGDLLVSGINAAKGAIAVYGEDNREPIAATIHYSAYHANKERVDVAYLWWLLRSHMFRGLLDRYVPGGIKTELKAKRLLPIPVPLPAVPEQHRLVRRIEGLASQIAEARWLRNAALAGAGALVPTAVAAVFSKGSSRGWPQGQLGDYVVDTCYGTSEKTSNDESGTPILRMGNIQEGHLEIQDLKYLHLGDKDRSRLLLRKGDILVNRTNSAELVGKCAPFNLEGEYAFASYLICLRLDGALANPRLVAEYINSPIGRAYMFSERKQMTGQANVNATKLKDLPIALPTLSEQDSIVAYLDELQAEVNRVKRLQAATAAELDAMLPSILDKTFRGEL